MQMRVTQESSSNVSPKKQVVMMYYNNSCYEIYMKAT